MCTTELSNKDFLDRNIIVKSFRGHYINNSSSDEIKWQLTAENFNFSHSKGTLYKFIIYSTLLLVKSCGRFAADDAVSDVSCRRRFNFRCNLPFTLITLIKINLIRRNSFVKLKNKNIIVCCLLMLSKRISSTLAEDVEQRFEFFLNPFTYSFCSQ